MSPVVLALALAAAPEDAAALCNQYGWLADLRAHVDALAVAARNVKDADRKGRLAQRVTLLEQHLAQLSVASPTTNPRAQCESLATLVKEAWAESLDPEAVPPFLVKDCLSPQKEVLLAEAFARVEQLASKAKDEPRRRRAAVDLAQIRFELRGFRSYAQCAAARDGLVDVESLLLDGGSVPAQSRLCRRPDWRALAEARLAAAGEDARARKSLIQGRCDAAEAALVALESR